MLPAARKRSDADSLAIRFFSWTATATPQPSATSCNTADKLPDGATWHDVMEEVYLQIVIDAGLKAGREQRTYTTEEIRKELGLPT